MRTFMFKDVADTLASGEKGNFLVVRARTRKSAVQVIEQANNSNILTYFGKVFFTGATLTNASKSLAKTGAFARYLLANSTRLIITGGTGVTTGEYVISTRTSDDAIVLSTDPGGSNPSDVAGYIIGGRTATLIKREYDNPPAAFPGVCGSGGYTIGTYPNDALRGVVYEQYIAAT